jgi:hypothetical protein
MYFKKNILLTFQAFMSISAEMHQMSSAYFEEQLVWVK